MKTNGILYYTKFIFPYLKPYWKIIVLSLICTLLYAMSNVYIMPLVNDITREVSNKNIGYFTNHVMNASLLFFLRLSSKYIQVFIMERASYQIMMDIRLKLYRIIHFFPTEDYSRKKHGDITSRILDDCIKIKDAVFLNFESLLPNVITFICIVGYLFYLSLPLALMSLIGAPIFIFTLSFFSKKLRKVSRQLQQNTADLTQMIQESLINMKILKIYTAEEKSIAKFQHLQKRYMNGHVKQVKMKIFREQIDAYSQFFIFLVIIWFGGYLSLNNRMSGSQLLSFFAGIVLLVDPIIILTKIYAQTFQVTASIERVSELMGRGEQMNDFPPTVTLDFETITFDGVFFKYPASSFLVLNGVSFSVKHGDLLGIVGASGSGKSTIASLIARYYLPTQGTITIDGHSIDRISAADLRANIAYVPQESLLFKETILDNCRIGNPNASIDDVIDALKLASAWEFVEQLPDKLLTKIGSQGLTLSGGQRQRLSIARAILSKPKLLILDEATSALDSDSESKIQSAIQSLQGQFTIIVIAHRLSTIKNATAIIVIDSGYIKESGSHHVLMNANGLYSKMIDRQAFS
jgi:ABC-type multidrug transport system fused ATPase/permease subunit